MADNLIQKSHKNSDKNKYNNVVHRTTSESLRLNESEKGVTHPTSLQAAHNPRKISSFQITSVTVGSRVSTDAGEDSADDLDESHTDDISRVTDVENETPSFSEDTFSKDEVFYNASSTSLGCAPVIPTSSQYGLAIVGQEGAPNQPGSVVPTNNSSQLSDMHVSVTNAGAGGIINYIGNAKPQEGMKEIQEHVRNERFKVVKIESTEPFRRGRWLCMDYLDHTTSQSNAPAIPNNNLDTVENNSIAPDSGVVINDSQHDEVPNTNDLNAKGPKEIQSVKQLEQTIQKQLPMVSPGQSLTQPLNMVQQQLPTSQTVTVQSPPLEMPQQMPAQSMQQNQVPQQHPQSMTHITLQNAAQPHPQPTQQQQVQQIPQSFPQHQLQQVIAQSQGIPMQQIPMHQQIPQQMQPLTNQAQMQLNQHLSQTQMPNMQQIPQQIPQMQGLQGQGQMQQVPNQQSQMQQMQMQQIQQSQQNPQQMHQIQQNQMPNMAQSHHIQNQQAMGNQQPQLQHLPSQAQMQAMQSQQIPNHIQQLQMQPQVPQLTSANQQIQMQTQIHQLPSQQQQAVVGGMHPQMPQQSMQTVQQQYGQAVAQQNNTQTIINPTIPSSQQAIVQSQHSVPQYHTQQSQMSQQTQMSQQGQTLPQEVLTSIASSQQANSMAIVTQPQAASLPTNLQNIPGQAQTHTMAPQQQQVPQANMQMIAQAPQNIQMIDANQANMQMPTSDQIYMQQTGQMPVNQHMMPQQAQGQMYVQSQQVPMAHQSMGMPMQQSLPVNMVPAQSAMPMYASNVVPVEATVSGTNSPVVSLPGTTGYAAPTHDAQGFGSPVSGVVSHVVSNVPPSESVSEVTDVQASDAADGKDDQQVALPTEDESINGLALALGGSGAGSPANGAASEQRDTAASSRAPSPPLADRQALPSASGTSAVAIDNKIEQAMDLVKSHLMFAVREEVEVLKERIAELMERINQLEVENTYLRAHASQDTLAALPAAKPAPPPPPAS